MNKTKCAACSGPHDLTVCTNRDHPACVSCGPDSQHSSNVCQCPAFQCHHNDLQKRFPEDVMPYFPVHNNPSTWICAPVRQEVSQPQSQYNCPPRNPCLQDGHAFRGEPTELFLRQSTMHNLMNCPCHRPANTPWTSQQQQHRSPRADQAPPQVGPALLYHLPLQLSHSPHKCEMIASTEKLWALIQSLTPSPSPVSPPFHRKPLLCLTNPSPCPCPNG